MRIQWTLILALIFALIVAVFAVVNVDPVRVDYMFGTSEIPLILIILGSALLGGLVVGSIGLFRNFMLQRKVKQLTNEKTALESKLAEFQTTTDNQKVQDEKEDKAETTEVSS